VVKINAFYRIHGFHGFRVIAFAFANGYRPVSPIAKAMGDKTAGRRNDKMFVIPEITPTA
jgi:hypothetical protein